MTIKQQGGIFGRNPSFNDVEIDGTLTASGSVSVPADSISGDAINGGTPTPTGLAVDGNVLYVDSVNNRVGINTSSVDEALHIEGSLSGNVMGLKIQNNNPDANSRAGIFMSTANGTWSFAASRSGGCSLVTPASGTAWTTNNSGNLAFPAGQGIDFSATSGTGTSELFDDYEEGEFTPAFVASGVTITHDVQIGRYVKIGDMVTVWINLGTDAVSGTAADLTISGLPYSTEAGYSGGISIGLNYGFSSAVEKLRFATSGTTIDIYQNNSATRQTSAILGTGTNANRLQFSGSYRAA